MKQCVNYLRERVKEPSRVLEGKSYGLERQIIPCDGGPDYQNSMHENCRVEFYLTSL